MKLVTLRRLVTLILMLGLAFVAATSLGTWGSGGSGGPVPGFSAGSWGGSPAPAPEYDFGILQVDAQDYCNGIPNPNFGSGATALVNSGRGVYAFWFLVSNYYATNTCGFNLTPYDWGVSQAYYFIFAKNATFSGFVGQWLGDVECGGSCICGVDWGDWSCDTQVNNRDVIKGFMNTLESNFGFSYTGFYSSPFQWQSITGDATQSDVGALHYWLAHWGATQDQLNSDGDYFTDLGFGNFSWQYTTTDRCDMTFNQAQTQAENSTAGIARFDIWTNSRPDIVC